MSEARRDVGARDDGEQGEATGEARTLVIATSNAHKIAELRDILAGLPYRLVSPTELGVTAQVEETGATFAENAILKAIAYAEATGRLALADDSGLEIDALGGEPGIYSARWAGPDVSYPERFRLLFDRLDGVSDEARTARYRCVIALAGPAPLGLYAVTHGVFEGRITREPRGSNGFGYDPIFYVPEYGQTVGELRPELKQAISHRARAASAARPALERLAQVDGGAIA